MSKRRLRLPMNCTDCKPQLCRSRSSSAGPSRFCRTLRESSDQLLYSILDFFGKEKRNGMKNVMHKVRQAGRHSTEALEKVARKEIKILLFHLSGRRLPRCAVLYIAIITFTFD